MDVVAEIRALLVADESSVDHSGQSEQRECDALGDKETVRHCKTLIASICNSIRVFPRTKKPRCGDSGESATTAGGFSVKNKFVSSTERRFKYEEQSVRPDESFSFNEAGKFERLLRSIVCAFRVLFEITIHLIATRFFMWKTSVIR